MPDTPDAAAQVREAVSLIGGPFDGTRTHLTKTPARIDVGGVRYQRLDDPDTGEFLGAYTRTIWDMP